MLEPAKTVVELCGGVTATAEMAERSEVRVRRWGYTKERGGSDGVIPSDSMIKLLTEAKRRNIDLRPEHFFPSELVESKEAAE